MAMTSSDFHVIARYVADLAIPATDIRTNQMFSAIEVYLDPAESEDAAVAACDSLAQALGRAGYLWDVWRPTRYVIAVAERRQE